MFEIDLDRQKEIVSTIRRLHSENGVFEIRILNTKQGTVSGYFDDPEAAVKQITRYIGEHDIYITMNPPDPSLLARSSNKLIPYAKNTTADADIDAVNWILVDLDPVRKAGISSSDEEKLAAAKLAKKIANDLVKEYVFPQLVLCDSGNGFHLLSRVNFPNNKETTAIIKDFLATLDFLYSTDKVVVDRSTFNASRIIKLHGTMACKGDDTEDRPHRWSRVIKAPDSLYPVTLEQLQSIIGKMPKVDKASESHNSGFSLEKWIVKQGIEVAYSADFHGDGTKYILKQCPWREEHTNQAAYLIQFKNGAVAAGCHHNSCQDENWHSLRDKCEPGWRSKQKEKREKDKSDSMTQVDAIIRLGKVATFFRSENGEAYARVPVKQHVEVFKVSSDKFKKWLFHRYYLENGKAFNQESFSQAVGVFSGMALFEGETQKLFRRCAWVDGILYYDLNNSDKEVVKVTIDGWEVITECEIHFERSRTMLPQATPTKGSKIDLDILNRHYRFKNQNDVVLHTVSLITKLIAGIPHPADVITGEKGSSKTTTQKTDRSIVDPNKCDILVMPKSRDELALQPSNHYFPCYDNLSNISTDMSDLLCMAATGGVSPSRKNRQRNHLKTE